ncbi:hypothetical protein FACS189447_03500 [Spirochaetia bacterium]|nr:hypothetical protein FACS189447_03500 [Spirochaetia bacterium]
MFSAIAGGNWLQGVNAGPRCVNLNNYAWNVNPNIGVRLACDDRRIIKINKIKVLFTVT